jgi:hypothetical protein
LAVIGLLLVSQLKGIFLKEHTTKINNGKNQVIILDLEENIDHSHPHHQPIEYHLENTAYNLVDMSSEMR